MRVSVSFYSYFKELTGSPALIEDVPPGTTVAELVEQLGKRFPKLGAMNNSMLVALGVDYVGRDHVLAEGDQLALFPPVQGG